MHTPHIALPRPVALRLALAFVAMINGPFDVAGAETSATLPKHPVDVRQSERLPAAAASQIAAEHLWIEAEDFTSLGGWQLTEKNTALLGHTARISAGIKDDNFKASTRVKIPSPGTYQVWVRSKDKIGDSGSRDFRLTINTVTSPAKLGAHGNDGWAWQSAGIFRLENGEALLELIDTGKYYARCDKLLFTNDLNYIPAGSGGDRNVAHAKPENTPAPLYVRANFNDLRAGSLAGRGSGEGFAVNSVWSVRGMVKVTTEDLRLPDADGRAYIRSQGGTPSLISASGKGAGQAVRELALPMKGQVWFSFLVEPQHESGSAGIKLLQKTSLTRGYEIVSAGRDLLVKRLGSSEAKRNRSAGVFPLGQTSVVIGRVDIDPDSSGDRFLSLWVNPNSDDLGVPHVKESLAGNINNLTHLAFVVASDKAGAPGPKLDEVILSNYPSPGGFYHVAPRKRHFGQWHIPVKVSEEAIQLPPPGYDMVFSDEFDSDGLDHTKWNYRLGDKADSAQEAENVEVRDGNLLVHARKQRVGQYHYTGGGVVSKPLFVYGYYEARFKIPAGEGWHTAFWTMPVYEPIEARNTENDFCEQDSGDPHYFSLGLINHREKGWNASNVGRWVIEDAPNMVEEFVVIAAEFTPEYIRFYMNGRLAKEVDARLFPHGPATVQLSCIATRKKGDRFQDDTRLPSQATFDYVRVYQHPRYAKAEASAKLSAVLPTKPLPPLAERQRSGTATGTLD